MKALSNRQKDVLRIIQESIQEQGFPPSVREIAAILQVSSAAGVHKHINALVKKGVLSKSDHLSRSLKPLIQSSAPKKNSDKGMIQLPLIGRVAAGFPIEAISDIQDYYPVPLSFVNPEKNHFILQVNGDSMMDEGILDGDFVVLEAREEARDGEMIVALIRKQEATLKRLYREGTTVRLQPANRSMPPLRIPGADLQIQGVVVAVLRRY
ncbi:MAG: transcriptional repressor LexA [Deltaproteobacteria bacterium]|nr:transcriptional repressor LexA [Deltaproteobacteria bacterium]